MADLMMPVLVLLLAYRKDIKLCSFEAYPKVDNAVSSMADKGGTSLAFLWLTKKAASSGSPSAYPRDARSGSSTAYPRGTGSHSSAAYGMVKVLALLRLTQEVGTSTDSYAAYPRGATRR
jgi:hypothetical protein